MHCWNIILRVKAKTNTELNEFKNFVHSDGSPLDFQNIIPITPPITDPSSEFYRPHWGTYYRPTFVKITKETTRTITYNFDADEVPKLILISIAKLFPSIKFDFYVDLDKKYILGGGMMKAVFRFNCFVNKTNFEIDDLSYEIYENEIENAISKINNKHSRATKYEFENLFDLLFLYLAYEYIPDRMSFLLRIYPALFKVPKIQDFLKYEYPGAFRRLIINDLICDHPKSMLYNVASNVIQKNDRCPDCNGNGCDNCFGTGVLMDYTDIP